MELLQLLIAGIAQGCVYGLLALGFVLIYKATEQVNFAQGDIMMMGTFFAFTFITGVSKPVQWWLVPAVLIAGAAAIFFYFVVHKRRLPAWRERAIERRTTPELVLNVVYWCNVVAITALAGAAMIMAIRFFGGFGMSWWLGLPLAAVFGAILGYALDAVIVRRIIGQPQFAVVILTVALGFGMRALASGIWGSDPVAFSTPYTGMRVTLAGGGDGGNAVVVGVESLVIIGGTAALIGLLYLFFRFTRIGVAMLAASQNQLAAYYMGIPVKYVFSMIWAISAGVATIAGVLLVPKLQVFSPEMGLLSIKAFAAAVIGGFGSLPGAIVGGLIIGIAEPLAGRYMPGSLAETLPQISGYIIMLLVLMVRPKGLFAQIQAKKV